MSDSCNPMTHSPLGSSVHGIFQVRILEWVAISFSREYSLPSNQTWLSCNADLRDVGSIPGSGRSPGVGHGNPFQYSYLENPMDRGTWRATVQGWQRVRHGWSDLACRHRPLSHSKQWRVEWELRSKTLVVGIVPCSLAIHAFYSTPVLHIIW